MSRSPILAATRQRREIRLNRDLGGPDARYLVVETPAALVLVPEPGSSEAKRLAKLEQELVPGLPTEVEEKDSQLAEAFLTLGDRIPDSDWRKSDNPYRYLLENLSESRKNSELLADVRDYLTKHPAVSNAVEMLFTSIAMSARADWRSGPVEHRGVLARGWFLGRWVPTFLVLDGPISRFLRSQAFRRQVGTTKILREVRAFLQASDFVRLRHAFAHWSFRWEVTGSDSEIVGYGKTPSDEVRLSRAEADAFHIITYAIIEVVDEVFVYKIRPPNPAAEPSGSAAG
ncbi:MAG: hypothetical protein SX243_11660 [Acidobacteriota bacterium]|nr:hypothetical protein [Acidobacteriota bacterium]